MGKVPECSGVRWKVLSKRILEGSNKYQKGIRVERLGIGVAKEKMRTIGVRGGNI